MNLNKNNPGEQKIVEWTTNKERLRRFGLYDPAHEHDAQLLAYVVVHINS